MQTVKSLLLSLKCYTVFAKDKLVCSAFYHLLGNQWNKAKNCSMEKGQIVEDFIKC